MMSAQLSWLTDPTVFQVNRLPAHSDHVCYASAEEAVRGGNLPAPVSRRGVAVRVEPQPRRPSHRLLAGGV